MTCTDIPALIDAIRRLAVRGAPLLGIAGAYGVALAAARGDDVAAAAAAIEAARPTAVNLGWGARLALDAYLRAPATGSDAGAKNCGGLRVGGQPAAIEDADRVACASDGCRRPAAGPGRGQDPDPLQHWLSGHSRRGHCFRPNTGRAKREKARHALDRRDPATAAGLAADGVRGGQRAGLPHPGARRLGGRVADGGRARSTSSWSAPTGSRPTAASPTRSAPTAWRCLPGITGAVRGGRPGLDDRLRHAGRQVDHIEQRPPRKCTTMAGQPVAPAGSRRLQPGVRRHPARSWSRPSSPSTGSSSRSQRVICVCLGREPCSARLLCAVSMGR